MCVLCGRPGRPRSYWNSTSSQNGTRISNSWSIPVVSVKGRSSAPSAYLASNQRMEAARTIRRVMEKESRTGLIVDHDVYFLDMVSDSLMVFSGEPGRHGVGEGPFPMRDGMNRFLRMVGITFRRDA